MNKPKLATLPELAMDLDDTLQQLQVEFNKQRPNKKIMEMLIHEASCKAISISGLIKLNFAPPDGLENSGVGEERILGFDRLG